MLLMINNITGCWLNPSSDFALQVNFKVKELKMYSCSQALADSLFKDMTVCVWHLRSAGRGNGWWGGNGQKAKQDNF